MQSFGLPWWLWWWRICLQCRRPGFDPWIRKIPWQKELSPTPVFLPGKFHGYRSLMGYNMGLQRFGNDLETNAFTFSLLIYLKAAGNWDSRKLKKRKSCSSAQRFMIKTFIWQTNIYMTVNFINMLPQIKMKEYTYPRKLRTQNIHLFFTNWKLWKMYL